MSTPEPPRKPRGEPLRWTEDDIDALSVVTPEDVERAKVAWRTHAPKKYRTLLEAQPDDGDESPT